MSEVPLYIIGTQYEHGARPVRPIVTMIKWIRTSRLSMKNSLTRTFHSVEYDPFIKSQLASMQLTVGRCVVQFWSGRAPTPGRSVLLLESGNKHCYKNVLPLLGRCPLRIFCSRGTPPREVPRVCGPSTREPSSTTKLCSDVRCQILKDGFWVQGSGFDD